MLTACGGGGMTVPGGGDAVGGDMAGGDDQISFDDASDNMGSRQAISRSAVNSPKEGSVTQSSNSDDDSSNPTTTDVVEVDVTYDTDETKLIYLVTKTATDSGITGSISSTDDDSVIEQSYAEEAGEKGEVELYQELPDGGRLWVDIYTDRELAENDPDYLAGGIWVYVPDNAESLANYEFGAFVDGNQPFTQTNLVGLTGTASYAMANGVTGVFADESTGENTFFDADVRLIANFGDDSVAGTIDGTINNVRDDDVLFAGAVLTLEMAMDADSDGLYTGNTSMTFETEAYVGKWGAQFYGNGDAVTDPPSSVAGTFGGATSDDSKSFLGVFGAYKTDE